MFSRATVLARSIHEHSVSTEQTKRNTMFDKEYGILTGEDTGEDVARQGHNR